MYRLVIGLLGAVLALVPTRSLERYEHLALADPASCHRRRWVDAAVRGEGVAFAVAALSGGRLYTTLLGALGVAGGVAALAPGRYLAFGGAVGYQSEGPVEWTGEFVSFVRALGLVTLLVAGRGFLRRIRESSANEA